MPTRGPAQSENVKSKRKPQMNKPKNTATLKNKQHEGSNVMVERMATIRNLYESLTVDVGKMTFSDLEENLRRRRDFSDVALKAILKK